MRTYAVRGGIVAWDIHNVGAGKCVDIGLYKPSVSSRGDAVIADNRGLPSFVIIFIDVVRLPLRVADIFAGCSIFIIILRRRSIQTRRANTETANLRSGSLPARSPTDLLFLASLHLTLFHLVQSLCPSVLVKLLFVFEVFDIVVMHIPYLCECKCIIRSFLGTLVFALPFSLLDELLDVLFRICRK